MAVGGTLSLTCVAENVNRRNWLVTRHGSTFANVVTNDSRITVTRDMLLVQIRDMVLEDAGVYQCLLGNAVDRKSIMTNVTIAGASNMHARLSAFDNMSRAKLNAIW